MATNLYNALSGGPSAAVPQPSAPIPPGSPGSGMGSLYQSLQQQVPGPQVGAQPLDMGPMVADNSDLADALRKAFSSPTPAPSKKESSEEKYARIRKENARNAGR